MTESLYAFTGIDLSAPTVTINPAAPTICAGSSVTLNALAAGGGLPYTYSWSPATGLSSTTISNPVANPATTTTYTVVVTDANNLSSAPASVTVTVNPIPSAPTATTPQTFCSGTNPTVANLVATGTGANTINWYNVPTGGTALASGTALTTGTYYVSQTDGNGCESARTSVTVTVNPTPVLTATPSPQTVCSAVNFTGISISSTVAGSTYTWSRNNNINLLGMVFPP